MVIWKKNYKYVKKPKKAEIIDTLKLQAENPQRMEKAMSTAKEYEYEFDSIRLAKVWDDWFVFGLDMDEGEKHQGIEMVGLTDKHCVNMMTDANVYVDIIEDAREYANIVTM